MTTEAKAKTWASSAGPRQTKAVDKALREVSWEGKTFVELTGVAGVSEHRSVMTSPFGNCRPEAGAGIADIGDRYEWSITAENHKRIIAELDTLKRRLEESRPVNDKRRTPDEESQRREETKAAAQDGQIEARAKQAAIAKLVEELRAANPWAEAEGTKSHYARAAANIKRELARTFPGVRFSVRSDSFSMGNSVDVGWTDGPTTKEVDAILGKYKSGSFDGMQDLYEYDNSAAAEAYGIVFGDSKYVQSHRSISPEIAETTKRMIAERYADDRDDKYWPIVSASSVPLGATVTGLEDIEEWPWCRLAFEVTPQPEAPAAVSHKADIQKHHHTKHGFDFFLVVLTDRIERDEFDRLRQRCEAVDGWYSRKWGSCPGGFAFKEEATAAEFAASIS